MNDVEYMRVAYQLALKGKGKTSPNPMVGAVLVKGERIIARGWHRRCGGPHAEIVALRQAGARARGAKLYVTMEPCGHFGRTPPCTEAIVNAGVREVVIGMKDPNPLMNGRSIRRLRRAGIRVKVGYLEDDLRAMNAAFIKYIRFQQPFIVAKIAQTLDGKTATAAGRSKWITAEKTRRFSRRRRNDFDAILVGTNTVRKDNPGLNAASGKKLKKVVLDSRLSLSPRARLFRGTRPQDVILAVTGKAPSRKIRFYQKRGNTVIVCPQKAGGVDIAWLARELARREITSVLVEGGARVIGSALKAGIVDAMHVYIAPKFFGDQKALSSIAGLNVQEIDKAVGLKGLDVRRVGDDLCVSGRVVYSPAPRRPKR